MNAPIALFVYNRPDHTQQTLVSLQKNTLAKNSHLYIFSDGPKKEKDIPKVNEVRQLLKNINGFKSVTVKVRKSNWGLAKSIIEGVTEIINLHERVIVLEDDIVTSNTFLSFMNGALNFYYNNSSVWHISGWNYPINIKSEEDVFMWRCMNCWGWATWKDKWKFFNKTKDIKDYFSRNDIYEFNLNGIENFFAQLLKNQSGQIDTWAIYWYAAIFKNQGLCVNPYHSFVNNIGLDGTGQNSLATKIYISELNHKNEFNFNVSVSENEIMLKNIKKFILKNKPSIPSKILNKIRTFFNEGFNCKY